MILQATSQSEAPTTASRPEAWRSSFAVAGLSLGLSAAESRLARLAPALEPFAVDRPQCELEIQAGWVERLAPAAGPPLFDSGAVWTARETQEGLAFDLASPALDPLPYKRLLVDRGFSRAQLLLSRAVLARTADWFPLEYPLDELLVTHLLSGAAGVEIHGCGLVDSGSGAHLFVGHSGAGKTTTARLWAGRSGVEVLSDDRVILRVLPEGIRMFGTPWHGEGCYAAPGSARLHRIFILEHGRQNEITLLPPGAAAAELFARLFVPFYSPPRLEAALAVVARIADLLPCYRFRFRAEASAVERVKTFHD